MKLIPLILNLLCLFPSSSIETQSNPSEEPLNIVLSTTLGGRSHAKYLMEIATTLRERGHSITYATIQDNFKFNKPYNYSIFSLGHLPQDHRELLKAMSVDDLMKDFLSFMVSFFSKMISDSYDVTFSKYEELFQTQKVDLIICDFFASPCLDAARKHAIPVISGFQGLGFGIASAPFITEGLDVPTTTTEHLTFFQRFKAAVFDPIYMIYRFLPLGKAVNKARAKYGLPPSMNPFGPFDQVFKITNSYIGFDDPRPIPSTLKLVGPVMDQEVVPLTEELNQFLDTHRVMYVAFGSNFILSPKLIDTLLGSMQLAIDDGSIDAVIWGLGRTNSEDFPETYKVKSKSFSTKSIIDGTHPTIRIVNWAPQVAVLNHPNTKLFLSHGGLESTFEGIHSGTPILCMPTFADQPRNAYLMRERGVGDFVRPLETDAYEVHSKIKELVREDNHLLHTNIKHLQSISHAKNAEKESNALFLEHYAQSARICRQAHPAQPYEIPCELEPYMSADSRMPFIKAYKIDILFTLAGLALALTIGGIFVIFSIFKSFISKKSEQKDKTE